MHSPYDSGQEEEINKDDSSDDSISPKHLVFIIHGMGGLQQFRVEQLIKTYKSVLESDFPNSQDLDVEFIPIDWHSFNVDSLRRLDPCGLPTIPILRRINNEVLSDVLYYFTKFHGQSIITHATNTFNSSYKTFIEKNPDFNGKIAIFAHSLGGIISHDIIRHQDHGRDLGSGNTRPENPDIVYPELLFKPNYLFNCGSPLSAVIVMRGLQVEGICFLILDYLLPSYCRHFNIFHIMDPLGYRLEPLFCGSYSETNPVAILRPSSKRSLVSSFYSNLKKSSIELSSELLNSLMFLIE